MPERKWIHTYSGRKFHPLDPVIEEVRIEDIAHPLGMQCRFNGHVRFFYSVAQHSVLVSDYLPEALKLWGLLHDAAEAYLPDICRPIKGALGEFDKIEQRVLYAVLRQFNVVDSDLKWQRLQLPPPVKEIDNRILADEAHALLTPMADFTAGLIAKPFPWDPPLLEPLGCPIEPWNPREASERFMERFEELTKS